MELGFERLGVSDRDCLCSWLIYVNELSNVLHVRILFIINVHFFFILALTATSVRMQQALPSNKQERKGKERTQEDTNKERKGMTGKWCGAGLSTKHNQAYPGLVLHFVTKTEMFA